MSLYDWRYPVGYRHEPLNGFSLAKLAGLDRGHDNDPDEDLLLKMLDGVDPRSIDVAAGLANPDPQPNLDWAGQYAGDGPKGLGGAAEAAVDQDRGASVPTAGVSDDEILANNPALKRDLERGDPLARAYLNSMRTLGHSARPDPQPGGILAADSRKGMPTGATEFNRRYSELYFGAKAGDGRGFNGIRPLYQPVMNARESTSQPPNAPTADRHGAAFKDSGGKAGAPPGDNAQVDEYLLAGARAFTPAQLGLTVQDFVSTYCDGRINRRMPGQFYPMVITEVLDLARQGDAAARTCIKLLSNGEYRK